MVVVQRKEGESKLSVMAKYTEAKCRLCRREGVKLFLKAGRCFSPKCPVERKGAVPPGQHGLKRRRELSSFGLQLRAKQRAKRTYGVLERQFRRHIREAVKHKQTVLQILERRLDNVVYRLGFTPSRSVARQIINHGHVSVNNRKIDVPSYLVKPEELINLNRKAQEMMLVKKMLEEKKYEPPVWLDRRGPVGKVLRPPQKEDIQTDINEQLIAEYYSR